MASVFLSQKGCSSGQKAKGSNEPYPKLVHISAGLLLQVRPNFLHLTTSCANIVEEVAEFAGVGLDITHVFLVFGIAFQDQNLMFWPH